MRKLSALAGAALALLLVPAAAAAFDNAKLGEVLDDDRLPSTEGKPTAVASGAAVNVFVFFRTHQEHSLTTLKHLAALEGEFRDKPVRWVAIASGAQPEAEVRQAAAEAGIRMPVLIDAGDALYGKLGVRLHPVIGIADAKRRLVAYEFFTKINFVDLLRARIRRQLGEIDDAQLERVLHPVEQVADEDLKGAERRVKLARTLLRLKDYEKALKNAREAAAKAPALGAAHAVAGQILAAQGKCPEALAEFTEALRLDPGDAAAAAGKQGCAGQ